MAVIEEQDHGQYTVVETYIARSFFVAGKDGKEFNVTLNQDLNLEVESVNVSQFYKNAEVDRILGAEEMEEREEVEQAVMEYIAGKEKKDNDT